LTLASLLAYAAWFTLDLGSPRRCSSFVGPRLAFPALSSMSHAEATNRNRNSSDTIAGDSNHNFNLHWQPEVLTNASVSEELANPADVHGASSSGGEARHRAEDDSVSFDLQDGSSREDTFADSMASDTGDTTEFPLCYTNWENWSSGDLQQLICFIDEEGYIDRRGLLTLPKPQLLMLLEFGTDMICVGRVGLDRVTNLRKLEFYYTARQQYRDLGSRYCNLDRVPIHNYIEHSHYGCFSAVQVGNKAWLRLKVWPHTQRLVEDEVLNDDPGPWVSSRISMNFSLRRATLRTDTDEYKLIGFFPGFPGVVRVLDATGMIVPNTGVPLPGPSVPLDSGSGESTTSLCSTVVLTGWREHVDSMDGDRTHESSMEIETSVASQLSHTPLETESMSGDSGTDDENLQGLDITADPSNDIRQGRTHKRSMTVPSHLSKARVEVIKESMERAAAELS